MPLGAPGLSLLQRGETVDQRLLIGRQGGILEGEHARRGMARGTQQAEHRGEGGEALGTEAGMAEDGTGAEPLPRHAPDCGQDAARCRPEIGDSVAVTRGREWCVGGETCHSILMVMKSIRN
jgi:hypothetical protein